MAKAAAAQGRERYSSADTKRSKPSHSCPSLSMAFGCARTRITMYNARVTVRNADGSAERRWPEEESEFRDVLRENFGLNLSDDDIRNCIEVMKAKGTGGDPYPFFA